MPTTLAIAATIGMICPICPRTTMPVAMAASNTTKATMPPRNQRACCLSVHASSRGTAARLSRRYIRPYLVRARCNISQAMTGTKPRISKTIATALPRILS